MPARSTDSLLQIEESLHSSLKKGHHSASLSDRLISANKRILLQHIEFRPAAATSSAQLEKLKSKYASINPSTSLTDHVKPSKDMECMKAHDDDLPDPKVVLYPPEKVKLQWPAVRRIGAGLTNLGNTCFLNSVLQCLTYTPPLVNYLSSSEHAHTCKQVGFCMVCELQRHFRRCYENGGQAIKPHAILQKIKLIAKHMHWGRQEDAHEFLRYVIDAMQKSCLNGNTKLDRISKETTVINQIFGGFLRSQVVCLKCKAKSNTYDPFLDISVDVKNVPNIQKAFEKFVQPEQLDLDNAYNCTKCKQKVAAQKRFTIHKPSNVLTIQLKRYGVMGGKVTRHISFPEKLNIRPYMSVSQGAAITYQLYAVLVHMGHSTNSGHYYCYVRSSNQAWYCMNDSMVQQTSQGRVLNSEAYMLFYIRCDAAANHEQPKQSPLIGPKLPQNKKHFQNEDMESTPPQAADVGTPVPRPKLIGPVKPPSAALGKPASPSLPVPRPTSITTQREKISFGIKPKSDTPKPRIVMHIKNGKVVHNSSVKKPAPLVPYETEEDESSEEDKRPLDVNATTEVPGSYGPLVKRERLTVNTALPVNATTKWQVVGDQLQSPSGNSSNSSSTHSTTEWHVTSAKEGTVVLPEAQHIGWTVTDKDRQKHSSIFTAILDQMQNNKNKKKADSDDSPMFSPSTRSPSPGERIDLAPLINGNYDEEEKDSHKKHKKQKKEKKKKKKKKHKKRDEDKEPLIDKEDGEISDSPPPSKRSSPQQAEEEATAPPVKASKSHAPVYEWDQHTKKDKSKEGTESKSTAYRHQGLPALAPKWDGRKQSKGQEDDVLEHLQRNSYGYGSQVSSWDGGESEVNVAAHADRRQNKRHWDDEYEEELDRGKTKKVKLHRQEDGYRGYHGNQFQKYQDRHNAAEDVRTGAIYNKNYYHDNRGNNRSNYGYQGGSSSSSSNYHGGDRHHSNNGRDYGHHRNWNHRSSFGKKNQGYAERYS